MHDRPSFPDLRAAALALIRKMVESQPAFASINRQNAALFGDFAPYVTPIADVVYHEVRALIRAAIPDDDCTVDYFLDECGVMDDGGLVMDDGGLVVEADGTRWPIKTVDDLCAYVGRKRS